MQSSTAPGASSLSANEAQAQLAEQYRVWQGACKRGDRGAGTDSAWQQPSMQPHEQASSRSFRHSSGKGACAARHNVATPHALVQADGMAAATGGGGAGDGRTGSGAWAGSSSSTAQSQGGGMRSGGGGELQSQQRRSGNEPAPVDGQPVDAFHCIITFASESAANPGVVNPEGSGRSKAASLPAAPPPTTKERVTRWLAAYFKKWQGVQDVPVPRPPPFEMALAFVGCFLAILLVAALTQFASPNMDNIGWVVTSFGASVTLLFAAPESKLVQPRNAMFGQIIGAAVGTAIRLALGPNLIWLSSALGTALAITIMQLTRTTHPPGGSTALFAASIPQLLPWQGFQLVLTVILGSVCLLLVAVIVNNVSPRRQYPTFWLDQRV